MNGKAEVRLVTGGIISGTVSFEEDDRWIRITDGDFYESTDADEINECGKFSIPTSAVAWINWVDDQWFTASDFRR